MSLILPWLLATLAGGAAWKWQESQQRTISLNGLTPPPQSVIIDPLSYAVLGTQGPFRDADSWTTFFNPTSTAPPFFQILHPDFLSVLGPAPSLRAIASNRDFAFAHEAPIWVPASDEVFFASNAGGPLGFSDWNTNNQVAKISMRDVERAVARAGSNVSAVNVSVQKLYLPDTIQMTNGGTGPFRGSLLLINSGRATMPPNLVLVNAYPPHNATVLLDNYFGRQFNSLNDVRVHPKGKAIFFTDVTYGWLNHFRPPPLLPNQVYRFDPDTGHVRVVADGFMRCNGLAFSKDGKTVYIADSGAAAGFLGRNTTQPSTIYAFDVEPKSQVFLNRRVFAYVDAGVPDGLQVDTAGNVYSGCADGVHVWNKEGTLIGKFFLGAESANLVFAGKGKLVMLAETVVYLAQIAADGVNLAVD
ncbi:D-lactonohydrolase-like protein [Laetiporus sulphureus 93-53]|uniref:D-lactonohydrolase-like protein n=1 Tax=Laetiporus sulphureus 93-53 TaxID=1314785 RepID=A0A165EBZ3_9APHY|nr:D-lactonohydrolase-like protein [Laetiporus sulphureus 93-53]KZT06693.1 D-lactonohydrolase-like protein [Laetiporus sulphureus 93-53]